MYIKLVIDQMKKFRWPGVWADDHSTSVELTRKFRLRRCLMWTINNWPGYDLLSETCTRRLCRLPTMRAQDDIEVLKGA